MQCNCYFVKVASSQRTVQYLFHGKTTLSKQYKYVILNLWDYYELEAQEIPTWSELCLETSS